MMSRSNVRVDNAPLNIRGTRKGIIQLCLLGREQRVPKGEKTPKRVHWIGVDDWIGYTTIISISWIDNEGKSNARFHPGQYAFPSSVPGKCYGRDVKVLSSFEWNNGQLQQLREGSPGIWEMVIFWKVLLLLMCRLIIVMLLLWLCGYTGITLPLAGKDRRRRDTMQLKFQWIQNLRVCEVVKEWYCNNVSLCISRYCGHVH